MENKHILLSIIIPVFNEETHVEEVLNKIRSVVLPQGIDREIIVIDDGSNDNTPQILKKFSSDNVISVHTSVLNFGKGTAIRIGIKKAKGDIILIQDADLEYNPDEFTNLLEPILSGRAKVVYGSRFKGNIIGMKFMYRLANHMLTFLANLLYRAHITDEATCYKIFTSDVIRKVDLKCKRFEFCPEITAKVLKSGEKIYEVPVSYRSRSVEEGKKISWPDALSAFWTLIKYRFVN
jgi:dolichol-phosphate mannosyltransferase